MLLAMLAQQQKLEGGESEGGYDEETDQLVIKAWGLNFAFLVHEIIKGLYEIISLHGFGTDKEKNQQIVNKVDTLANEPDDLRFGKFIYDAINKLFVESKYTDQRIKEYLFTEIYKLENPEFKSFIENLIKNKLTSSQIKWVNDAMDSIQSDLTKDDTGLTGLDEQFTRMQKLAGVIFEEEPVSSRINMNNIPEGWSNNTKEDLKNWEDEDTKLFGGKLIASYSAPMEGWDENHEDEIKILKTENGYKLDIYVPFGSYEEDLPEFKNIREAFNKAVEIMEAFKNDWDNGDY
jgi:hypothetical protein